MIFILLNKDNYLYLHRGFKCNLGNKYTKIIESMAKVLVEHGEVAKLARLFGIARKTVSEALSGQTNTDLAKKIRKVAIDRGGVVQPTRIYKR